MAVNSGIALGAAPDLAGQRVTWRQWYMAFLLTFLYIYAQIDSGAIILMVDPIKRDLGVKDWGSMIEGHGGILDRLDSVSFAAPLFFHLTRYYFAA